MAKKRSGSKKGTKKYRIELTRLSIVLWGGCFFFVLAWIFVLGILVGRGFLPGTVTALSQLKAQINTLQAMVSRNKSHDLSSPKKAEPDPQLAFYEKLSSKKDEAKKEWAPKGSAGGPNKEANRRKGKTRQGVQQEKQAEGLKREARQTETRVSQLSALEKQKRGDAGNEKKAYDPNFPGGQYTVQLASLGEKAKAEKMIGDLQKRGYPAYFYEVEVKGKTYYRVRCGRFAGKGEAGDYASKLKTETGIKGFVSKVE